MLVEVLLEFLVGVVDVELLEPIDLEIKGVRNANQSDFIQQKQRCRQIVKRKIKTIYECFS